MLDVARRRPLEDALTIRRGPNKGQLKANIRSEVRERLERLGRERALIYKTMALTGLRKNELATLTVKWLELNANPPYLTLDPNNEKNGMGSSIPLRADLAADICAWLQDKAQEISKSNGESDRLNVEEQIYGLPADTPLFDVPTGLLRILDRDLKAAGISKKDSRGRTVDIHALRHTFGTMLSAAGVKPRTAQEVMRHSDIKLTMNVYTDPALLDTAGAVEALPSFPLDRPETPTNRNGNFQFAPKFAPTTGHPGQSGTIPAKMAAPNDPPEVYRSRAVRSCYDNSKGPLSITDNGPYKVGAKGRQ